MGELLLLVPHPWDALGPPQPLGAPSTAEMEVLADKIRALRSQGDEKTNEAEDLKEEATVLEREADELYSESEDLIKELKGLPGGKEMANEWD